MKAKIERLEKTYFWRILLGAERLILVFVSAASALMITYSVVLRYITHSDLFGMEEFMTIFAIWLYYIGAAVGSCEDSHIKADFFSALIKNKKVLKIRNCIVYGITVVISIFIAKLGIDYAAWSIQAGGTSTAWHFPLIISQIPITIGLVLILFYSTYHFIKQLQVDIDHKEEDGTKVAAEDISATATESGPAVSGIQEENTAVGPENDANESTSKPETPQRKEES